MIAELTIATLMVFVTIAFHALGLAGLSKILRVDSRRARRVHPSILTMKGFGFTLAIVLGLFVIHGVEIWLYSVVYYLLGAIPDLRESLYFSIITYGAIGYDDAPIAEQWKLVSAIEGINGVLLLGWSTAYFVTVVVRFDR